MTALVLVLAAAIPARVDFSRHLRTWDGFGVNYVEVAQTRGYKADPQEYGGFSILPEKRRQEILDLIFGPDGLKPGLLKMFLDPFHEPVNDNSDPNTIDAAKFDHTTTTKWMRYFAREGLKRTKLTVITTLYGPPGWTTKQRIVRGRDLDPAMKQEVAEYMIAWAKYLRENEGLPVRYISLHNEGEDWVRWPEDGGDTPDHARHDYNMWWPPEQVADFLRFMPAMLARHGLKDVAITPGETTNWYRFDHWGYASAIAKDSEALKGLGLITSHGFISLNPNARWFGDWRSAGNDLLREKKPGLHSWVTSQSWSRMDVNFINEIRGNIYSTKCNGVIPWAAVQRPPKWAGGDPNPGTAFNIAEDGTHTVRPGYYLYKQVSRAGQPGMAVAEVSALDSEVGLMAFAGAGTKNPDAFVVLNLSKVEKPLAIRIDGTRARSFRAWRTSPSENYSEAGAFTLENGAVAYTAPAGSVTTFFAQ